MTSLYLLAFLQYALIISTFVFSLFFQSIPATAQMGTSESVGGRQTNSRILVFVRDSTGAPITTSALVRLYTSDGTPMGQVSVGNGGQVTFSNLHPGSYNVEVEAPGYIKAHEEAMVPTSGEFQIQVYLRRESETDSASSSLPETPVLAPKAKKELDAGLEALRRKDLSQARKHLEQAGDLAPTHPDVLYLLGTLYSQMNDLPRAERFLKKALEMNPQHARAQATLGIVLAGQHKCDTAVPALQKALEANAQSWEARWALARCHYHERNFQLALEQARQALRDSNGDAPEIGLVAAASLTALGQYEESAATLRQFLQKHPDGPEAARARRWLDYLQHAGKITQN
jgi:Tfp pilus assembly protein PilF